MGIVFIINIMVYFHDNDLFYVLIFLSISAIACVF